MIRLTTLTDAHSIPLHQFFSNSSGGLAPDVLVILQREGLSDHALELQRAMEMLGNPYPRNRDLRHAAMEGFTDAQHDALNGPIRADGAMKSGAGFPRAATDHAA